MGGDGTTIFGYLGGLVVESALKLGRCPIRICRRYRFLFQSSVSDFFLNGFERTSRSAAGSSDLVSVPLPSAYAAFGREPRLPIQILVEADLGPGLGRVGSMCNACHGRAKWFARAGGVRRFLTHSHGALFLALRSGWECFFRSSERLNVRPRTHAAAFRRRWQWIERPSRLPHRVAARASVAARSRTTYRRSRSERSRCSDACDAVTSVSRCLKLHRAVLERVEAADRGHGPCFQRPRQ